MSRLADSSRGPRRPAQLSRATRNVLVDQWRDRESFYSLDRAALSASNVVRQTVEVDEPSEVAEGNQKLLTLF